MRWTKGEVAMLTDLHRLGAVPATIAAELGRSHRSVRNKIAALKAAGELPGMRARGRPPSPPSGYVDSRARERDRDRKERFRMTMVERSLRVTPAQAEILERARARGGFRSTSALVRAVLQGMPDEA